MRSIAAAFGAMLAMASAGNAQEPADHKHGPEDHALGKLGKVTFPVSCDAEAGVRFERAMAVLHSFWWEEGDAAFGRVLEADSDCAMAHWGLAMNAWGNPFAGGPAEAALARGAEAAAIGVVAGRRRPRGSGGSSRRSPRSIATPGRPPTPSGSRPTPTPWPGSIGIFPRTPRSPSSTPSSLIATAPKTDTTFAQQKRAAAILNPLFARYPQHPGLAHYIIHSTDSPQLARLGLSAARRYAKIAPAAPHAQHMPSHIFVRLGYWDETVASNWVSFNAGVANAKAKAVPPAGEVLHALDYAVYGYLQRGQDSAARATVATAQSARSSRGQEPGGRLQPHRHGGANPTGDRRLDGCRLLPGTPDAGRGNPGNAEPLHPGDRGGPEWRSRGRAGRGGGAGLASRRRWRRGRRPTGRGWRASSGTRLRPG